MRVPTIAPFLEPEQWVRPAFLPPSPSPPEEEAPPPGSSADGAGSLDSGRKAEASADDADSPSSEKASDGASVGTSAAGAAGAGAGTADGMDVDKEGGKAGEGDGGPKGKKSVAGAGAGQGSDREAPGVAADGKGRSSSTTTAAEATKKVAGDVEVEEEGEGKEEAVEKHKGKEKKKGKEKGGDPEAGTVSAEMEEEELVANKQADEAAELEAAAAAEKAEEKAKAKVAVEAEVAERAEAAKKAEAERRAKTEAEKRSRKLRVSVILQRLRLDATERKSMGRYKQSQARGMAESAEGGSAGRGAGQDVIAVPGLLDGGDGVVEETKGTGRGGKAGDAGEDAVESAKVWEWPPLGQRRLKGRLDCAKRHAAIAQSRDPGPRLDTLLRQDASQGKTGGDWLEAKLARMRKVEDGEWKAWQSRVVQEQESNPGETAGPPLPFGFVPRLAHRTLGAYAMVRTFSRPCRLTPATSIAFLRAMTLRLRTPLLDAVHCELLRRVCCLLRGRAGGWAKGSSAQRELDWKYLDQVRADGGGLCLMRVANAGVSFSSWWSCVLPVDFVGIFLGVPFYLFKTGCIFFADSVPTNYGGKKNDAQLLFFRVPDSWVAKIK